MITKPSPKVQAIGGLILPPFAAASLLLVAAGCLVIWPLLPFLLYFQRKEELRKEAERLRPECFGDYPINDRKVQGERECNSCRLASECYSATLAAGKNVAPHRPMA